MYLVTRILFSAMVLLLIEKLVPGVSIPTLEVAIVAAMIIGILNAVIKPILVVLTLPITIVTLGLFIFVINTSLFMLAAYLIPAFDVAGFVPAFWGALIMSVGGVLANRYIKK